MSTTLARRATRATMEQISLDYCSGRRGEQERWDTYFGRCLQRVLAYDVSVGLETQASADAIWAHYLAGVSVNTRQRLSVPETDEERRQGKRYFHSDHVVKG